MPNLNVYFYETINILNNDKIFWDIAIREPFQYYIFQTKDYSCVVLYISTLRL